ncbi:MAG: ATP-dependent zinc metalloprotease FtsH [Bacteroidales bacterium]|nr:ATP-dependent zinc metalloprotease FtsH [Bacteroidales bacterium]
MAEEKDTKNTEQEKQDDKRNPFAHGDFKEFKNFKAPKGNKNGGNIWIYVVLLAVFAIFSFMDFGGSAKKITSTEFDAKLRNGEIEKLVVVNREYVDIYLTASNTGHGIATPDYTMTIGSIESFERKLENTNVNIEYQTKHNYVGEIIGWLLPIVLMVVIWMFFMKKMGGGGSNSSGLGGGIFSIGKSRAKLFENEDKVKTTFKDVAGLEEAKIEIREIVDFLKNPKKYTELGGKIPKGALLVGPPGTGKTLLAKAVAGEAGVPFFSLAGSDFVEMFVGVGAARVRDLFKEAKAKAPSIIFIDEIDAIGRARGKNGFNTNDERESTLNQLLTEMDGFGTDSGVIVLAATNRAEILDKALLRAGRFDRQINVELPDLTEREQIFDVHLRPLKLAKEIKSAFLAKQTPGFSGADIANVCNEAALIAARRDKKQVEKQDFLDAIDRIVGGLEKRNKIMTQEEKRTIAFHEAGHATLSWFLEYAHPLIKVTIIPRGRALGAAWYLPEERQIVTKEQILDELCATLGGRVAEQITFGKISTGALNDLEKVTKQAYAMVQYYGMSDKIGNLSFYDSTGQSDYTFAKPYGEEMEKLIDAEAQEIIRKSYQRAYDILTQNQEGFVRLAELLLDREVIFSEDLEKIFGKRPFGEPKKVIDEIEQNNEQA